MTEKISAALPVRPVPLRPGDELDASPVGPLTRTDFVRYAGAGGDLNPIHHDEPLAKDAGAPSVFGMGMLHAGMLGTRLARWVGPDNIRRYRVRFVDQVWPDDTLSFVGQVRELAERDGTPVARIDLAVVNQKEVCVLKAEAEVEIEAKRGTAPLAQQSVEEEARELP